MILTHDLTWTSPDGRIENQIDHFLIDTRHESEVINCRSYRGVNIDSDHYPLIAKIRARISKVKKGTKLRQKRFKVRELKARPKPNNCPITYEKAWKKLPEALQNP